MEGEENIIRLHEAFKKIRVYKEKVEFYDRHFGSLLHAYPVFNTDLGMLFHQNEFDYISSLFENERRKAIILEKRFIINGKLYLFNVTPVNSNTQVLNDFILYKFINLDTGFNQNISEINQCVNENPGEIWEKWLNALNRIDSIERKLSRGEERGLRYRFMNVFINGYLDQKNGLLKKFYNKKKFIELYLYAQGVLYRRYFEQLHDHCDFSVHTEDDKDENVTREHSDIQLLKDYLRKKYNRKESWADSNVVTLLSALLRLEANKKTAL